MIETAQAFWVLEPGRGEVRGESIAPPGPGEVLVQTRYSAISRGTEALVFNGRVPPSEYDRMRCPHQVGDFPGPLKYGYISVGTVRAGSAALAGRLVFCLFPHQSAYVVPENAVLPLPEGVTAERAVLAANMETALNAVWDGAPRLGDRISVVGAGVLGCLCAYLLGRHPGVTVELLDVRPERAAVAEALGVCFASPEHAALDRDLVVHASGSEIGLRSALGLAAPGSTVLELSWFGDAQISLPLGGAFHQRRLQLRASQVGSLSPRARPRFDFRARLALALELCRDPVLDVLIDSESAFETLPQKMPQLAASSRGLCHRLRYEP